MVETTDGGFKPITLREWLDALRSGRYLQGRESLCYTDDNGKLRHCCLGVGISLSNGTMSRDGAVLGLPVERFISDLPSGMWDYTVAGGYVISVNGYWVSAMNDADLWNFEQIADAVESYAKELGWKG